ncbi:MAG TPA: hypothetical protein VMU33_00520 [Burkholderiaceae bacterium]|nr:hypothetical protein [Burkholderiaceae bacterium]
MNAAKKRSRRISLPAPIDRREFPAMTGHSIRNQGHLYIGTDINEAAAEVDPMTESVLMPSLAPSRS